MVVEHRRLDRALTSFEAPQGGSMLLCSLEIFPKSRLLPKSVSLNVS